MKQVAWVTRPDRVAHVVALTDLPELGQAEIGGRIDALAGKTELDAPVVSAWNGKISVVDGRHRIELSRRAGLPSIVVQCDPEDDPFVRAVLNTRR